MINTNLNKSQKKDEEEACQACIVGVTSTYHWFSLTLLRKKPFQCTFSIKDFGSTSPGLHGSDGLLFNHYGIYFVFSCAGVGNLQKIKTMDQIGQQFMAEAIYMVPEGEEKTQTPLFKNRFYHGQRNQRKNSMIPTEENKTRPQRPNLY